MRTGNPALSDNTFTGFGRVARAEEAMTAQGTANKALLLLLCVLVTASWTWGQYYRTMNPQAVTPWVMVGAIAGFIVALVTVFKPTWAAITAPLYALLEGLVIGGVSAQQVESSLVDLALGGIDQAFALQHHLATGEVALHIGLACAIHGLFRQSAHAK